MILAFVNAYVSFSKLLLFEADIASVILVSKSLKWDCSCVIVSTEIVICSAACLFFDKSALLTVVFGFG